MTKVDLKDAYFMVPIAQHQRRLLCFRWQVRTYQFTCLPFGLSSATWAFKTTRPIMTTLRSLGLRMIIYIDDILIMAETKLMAKQHTAGLIFLLEKLGFITKPTQEIDFLGLTINSQRIEIKMPGEKIR